MGALEKYLDFLWTNFQHDMHVFSHPWMYYWLLVPALAYLVFFLLKWIVFTAPVWLPVSIIIRVFNLPSPQCRNCVNKTMAEFDDLPASVLDRKENSGSVTALNTPEDSSLKSQTS